MNESGRVAIVTGGSRGIGRAVAIELARRGARVVVNYQSSADAAASVVAEIAAQGGTASSIKADVRLAEDAERIAKHALELYGTIDILVNNAGIARDGLLLRMKEKDWYDVLDTNLSGAFHCVKAVQRTLLKKRWGRIINMGSVVGLAGNAGQANYAAAKAGLVGFTKALAKEFGPRGITANLVAPGYIETDMTAGLAPDVVDRTLTLVPLSRMGMPDDVAAAVAFFASEDAGYITGQVLRVDGGLAI